MINRQQWTIEQWQYQGARAGPRHVTLNAPVPSVSSESSVLNDGNQHIRGNQSTSTHRRFIATMRFCRVPLIPFGMDASRNIVFEESLLSSKCVHYFWFYFRHAKLFQHLTTITTLKTLPWTSSQTTSWKSAVTVTRMIHQ